MDRRDFLTRAATSSLLILRSARTAFTYQANERLELAVVGMAGYANAVTFAGGIHTLPNVGIRVTCDVDLRKVARIYSLWEQRAREWPTSANAAERSAADLYARLANEKPPLYDDFRRMLDEAADRIDAVTVATPDHSHAVIAAAALRAGKPVFAEKPLTISVHEARALRRLTVAQKVATSMGNQGTASPQFRRGVEIVREGVLGPVEEVHVFFSRGGQNFRQPPQGVHEVPRELNWNLWLAQLAWREYHPAWINRVGWRGTSLGELGNFAPHTANLAFMGLEIGRLWEEGSAAPPIRVSAECSEINRLSYPTWERIRWEVPARGERPPVTLTWHHGPLPQGRPAEYAPGSRQRLETLLRDHGATDRDVAEWLVYAGALLVGGRGILVTNSHNTRFALFPRERFADVPQDRPQQLPASPGHYQEWVNACRGDRWPLANFTYAGPFAEFIALGEVATRFAGEVLEFDPVAGRIRNHADAHAALSYEYRAGWRL